MTASVQVLHGGVVGVFVRDEEGTADLTAVGVGAQSVEDLFVEVDVVDVDGAVECKRDHLWDVHGFQVAGDASTVGGAETVGEHALGGVAVWCAVGISFNS